eukprot:CCRYP_007727-RA/>CCRYP_007727-RA protein AED:0.49 eAED:0.50 QI:0/0/0/1/0/0/2/0/87
MHVESSEEPVSAAERAGSLSLEAKFKNDSADFLLFPRFVPKNSNILFPNPRMSSSPTHFSSKLNFNATRDRSSLYEKGRTKRYYCRV